MISQSKVVRRLSIIVGLLFAAPAVHFVFRFHEYIRGAAWRNAAVWFAGAFLMGWLLVHEIASLWQKFSEYRKPH
jgi:hypothetical protein